MNRMTEVFDFRRFVRVLLNDLMLLQPRRIAFASLGIIGIGMLIYMTNATHLPGDNTQVAQVCFMFLLLGGGSIFTSMIYNDMHHPLERFHYLLLPCSNLERFVSRYLITAPFFVLYAIVLYKVFEVFANAVLAALWDARIPPLDVEPRAILDYLAMHVVVYTGAIWFRSYALIKTAVANALFWAVFGAVAFIGLRVIYWDHFISLFEMDPANPVGIALPMDDDGSVPLWQKVLFTAFLLWMLFLAYLGLREHEVQDGL